MMRKATRGRAGGRRRRYFIEVLDPCGFIELSRGCLRGCSSCRVWTFYGWTYRQVSSEAAVEDLGRIRDLGVLRAALYLHAPVRLRGKAPRRVDGDARRADPEPIK